MDRVIGVVPTKEFLSAYHAEGDTSVLQLIAQPPAFVPDTIPLDNLLLVFDEKKTHFAILVDEHGGVEGIVTLSDVVDELIGDPKAADEAVTASTTPASPGGPVPAPLVISGELPIHELAARIGKDRWGDSTDGVVTVGGLVSAELGRIPMPGEEVAIEGVVLRVVEADLRMAKRIEVTVLPTVTADAGP
jgi:CBS domain containing-hemolysin-like protein